MAHDCQNLFVLAMLLLFLGFLSLVVVAVPSPTTPDCASILPQGVAAEIASYQPIAAQIRSAVLNGPFRGRSYRDLALFADTFGSRMTGTSNLEASIDYMLAKMKDDHLENVHGEKVIVSRWVRGHESAQLLSPRRKTIAVTGLAESVSTPKEGITAELLVVNSFGELRRRADDAKGKIIVFTANWTNSESYLTLADLHFHGAAAAARVGGLAALSRPASPFSIYSLLSGRVTYEADVQRIPAGMITIEDAEFFQRCQDRGWKMVVNLKMTETRLPSTKSRNSIGELVGRERPEEIVALGAHIDSYDVVESVMDDGGGVMVTELAMTLLQFLNLRPRRSLRSIFWTGDEMGRLGQKAYIASHEAEFGNHVVMFDIDRGTFAPVGFDFVGSPVAGCIVQEVLKLLAPINATTFKAGTATLHRLGGLYPFTQKGVTGMSMRTGGDQFYWYHHSQGDTMTIEQPNNLDNCLVALATTAYVISDISVRLPKE